MTRFVYGFVLDALKALIGTEEFPERLVDHATRQFIELLEYLRVVYVQDLAVLWPRMKKHVVYTIPPFNSLAFHDYREKLEQAIKDFDVTQMRETAQMAIERGSDQMAQLARDCLKIVLRARNENLEDGPVPAPVPLARAPARAAAPEMRIVGTPVRQINAIHARVCANNANNAALPVVYRPPAAAASTDADEPPSSEPEPEPEPTASAPTLLFGIEPINPLDPSTWPKNPDRDSLPFLAKTARLSTALKTVQGVADEWYRGVEGNPPIKYLEEFYGPGAPANRTGRGSMPYSWRSGACRKDGRDFEKNHFNKRKPIYAYLEEKGEAAGVTELARLIKEAHPNQDPAPAHLEWLRRELVSGTDKHEKYSIAAKEGAKKRTAAAKARKEEKRLCREARLAQETGSA